MCVASTESRTGLRLEPFDPRHAAEISRWADSEQQLRWLAPSTGVPLTAEKVVDWKRPGGSAFVLTCEGEAQPIGYGELNPMRGDLCHQWLGHVVIRPDRRGRGIGRVLVGKLLEHASRRLGADRVSLVVFPDNRAAVRCYVGAGFKITGEEYHRFGEVGPKHRLLRLVIEIIPRGMAHQA